MDARNEGMADAGEWRGFVLRMLLRELVERRARRRLRKALANTGQSLARRIVLR